MVVGNSFINLFFDCPCFKENYILITIDLCKQQAFDADPKTIQKINFTENLRKNAKMFLIFKEVQETVLDISKSTVRVLGKISIDFFIC